MASTAKDQATVTLAHPLSEKAAERLGLEAKEYQVGDKVTVSRGNAGALIDAGYVQVDPTDTDAVAKVLTGKPAATPPPSASSTA